MSKYKDPQKITQLDMVTKFDGYTLLDVQHALHNVYKCVEKVKPI